MLKSTKAMRLKSDLAQLAEGWERENKAIIDAVATVRKVVDGTRYSFTGATLVETRSRGGAVFATMPVNILGVRFRVGGGAPIKRDVMTAIDVGDFTIDVDRATFVGGKQQRVWEYKKIVGYNTEAAQELLIAVSNRQRMSGIRYGAGADFLIDAAFNAAVERHRGNPEAVTKWAQQAVADLKQRIETGKHNVETDASAVATELVRLIGKDEVSAFVQTLPGLNPPSD